MSTVSKSIADRIIAGEFPEDGIVRIVKYINAWGDEAYGIESLRSLGKYEASDYVIDPEVYWEHESVSA